MLNISVAPQIKSSGENTAALLSPGSSGNNNSDPVTEDFSKVLDRQVSEATDKQEKNQKNDTTAASAQEHADNDNPSKDKDTDSAADVPANGSDTFIQSLLTDATTAYKTTPSLQAMGTVVNPDAMVAASVLPQGVSSVPVNTPLPQETEQISNAVIPATNQLLQQSQNQANSAASNPASRLDNYWQYLGTADSAASGKFLPPADMNEDLRLDNATLLLKTQEEPLTTQSFGLNSTTTATSQNPVSQDIKVDAPVGQHRWGGEFAQKIVWLSSQQHQVAEIRLNPAHLGPVEVMLSITQDQATAQFVSPHSAVRDAIQEALPRLREMMAENGIQLGNVMVGADSFQQENKQQQAFHAAKDSSNVNSTGGQETTGQVQTAAVPVRHQGLVNTYA